MEYICSKLLTWADNYLGLRISSRAADTSDTAPPLALVAAFIFRAPRLPRWHRQSILPAQHASEQARLAMDLRQE
jgi:hypothetical protein